MRLYVHRWGSGPRIVFVHGALLGGREAWRAQRPLTRRWTVLAPDRPGHGRSSAARTDFEPEAGLIAEQLLDEPAHLVGLSYGAIVGMYAAALRPENVSSLTIVEPPCSAVAKGVPVVDSFGADVRAILELTDVAPAEALRRFFRVAGVREEVVEPVPEVLLRGINQLFGARPTKPNPHWPNSPPRRSRSWSSPVATAKPTRSSATPSPRRQTPAAKPCEAPATWSRTPAPPSTPSWKVS